MSCAQRLDGLVVDSLLHLQRLVLVQRSDGIAQWLMLKRQMRVVRLVSSGDPTMPQERRQQEWSEDGRTVELVRCDNHAMTSSTSALTSACSAPSVKSIPARHMNSLSSAALPARAVPSVGGLSTCSFLMRSGLNALRHSGQLLGLTVRKQLFGDQGIVREDGKSLASLAGAHSRRKVRTHP